MIGEPIVGTDGLVHYKRDDYESKMVCCSEPKPTGTARAAVLSCGCWDPRLGDVPRRLREAQGRQVTCMVCLALREQR